MKKILLSIAAICLFASAGFCQANKTFTFAKVLAKVESGGVGHIPSDKRLQSSLVRSCGSTNVEAVTDIYGGKTIYIYQWDAAYQLDARTGKIILRTSPYATVTGNADEVSKHIKSAEGVITTLLADGCPSS